MVQQTKETPIKSYLFQWTGNYVKKYGIFYKINWAADSMVIKRIRSKITKGELVKLIDFCFVDHPATSYLRTNHHRIAVFGKVWDQILLGMKFPGSYIPDHELLLDIPYWQDERVKRLWTLILRSDLETMKTEIKGNAIWDLLLAKMRIQDGFINEQTEWLMKMWKAEEIIDRKAIKRER
jgi:hypothetical protein